MGKKISNLLLFLYFLLNANFIFAKQYPSFFIMNKGHYTAYETDANTGSYIIAPVNGIVTKIKNMNAGGDLKFVEFEDEKNDISVGVYYLDGKSLKIKVGDKVSQGDVIGKLGNIEKEYNDK